MMPTACGAWPKAALTTAGAPPTVLTEMDTCKSSAVAPEGTTTGNPVASLHVRGLEKLGRGADWICSISAFANDAEGESCGRRQSRSEAKSRRGGRGREAPMRAPPQKWRRKAKEDG